MSVGVGVGLIFLAREGLSFATLRQLPPPTELQAQADPRRGRGAAVLALACPASLKGVLTPPPRPPRSAQGLRAGGADATELPVADGGEGTAEALRSDARRRLARGGRARRVRRGRARARWLLLPDGTAVVESAAAVPLDPDRLDPLAASSRGYGELVAAALEERPAALLLCLGGTATMDGGVGLLEVLGELPVPARVACDVRATLAEAPRLFGPQKGAGPAEVAELERRLAGPLRPGPRRRRGGRSRCRAGVARRDARGRARRSCSTRPASTPRGFDLVVTGEGRVDATTAIGKAPGEVARRSAAAASAASSSAGSSTSRSPASRRSRSRAIPRGPRRTCGSSGSRWPSAAILARCP